MSEGNNIVDESQLPKLTFNPTTGTKVGPFAKGGWYQLVATQNCFVCVVSAQAAIKGDDAASVTSDSGCDLFSGNGEKWYIPDGGYLGAIGYPGKSGDIRIFRVRRP
ncbi:hypothetical protein [Nitrosomonas oligotropha]|uniref:hypothetical protein n=1 Tax=Nitrosomonas oligotropha TaxID=42354 RepID=UPI00136B0402|nr:hypothetical protein [Nitrosomonas oligotropha]MXS83970.1 hypothetical protein [Nitrosomonas oligotropha]